MSIVDEKILLFDGACGTNLQEVEIPDSAWQGCEGCNELLNVTAPDVIVALHESFLDAGATVVETNTFGARLQRLTVRLLPTPARRSEPVGGGMLLDQSGRPPNCHLWAISLLMI